MFNLLYLLINTRLQPGGKELGGGMTV